MKLKNRAFAAITCIATVLTPIAAFAENEVDGVFKASQSYEIQDNVVISEDTTTINNSPSEGERILADLRYENSLRLTFSYNEVSGEFILHQTGTNDKSKPIMLDEEDGLLKTFLAITPNNVPVPEMLVKKESNNDSLRVIKKRGISPYTINVTGLKLSSQPARNNIDTYCYPTGNSSDEWNDGPSPRLEPKTYESSKKVRGVSSFISLREQGEEEITSVIPEQDKIKSTWVRHRIYDKNRFGVYKEIFGKKVSPRKWSYISRISMNRLYSKVVYDHSWNGNPSYSLHEYIRQGGFTKCSLPPKRLPINIPI
ncbi:MAG: hypothetical protein WBA39_13170 [Rivularia sp. (in: cyanobacteria)]